MVGFYTDRFGRRRPITPRKRKTEKIGSSCLKFRVSPDNGFRVKFDIVKKFLIFALKQVPVIRECWAIYTVADSIYQNWKLIKQQWDRLDNERPIETKKLMQQVVSPTLASIQSDIVWNVICPIVPKELSDSGRTIVDQLFNKITDEEIDFVNRSL